METRVKTNVGFQQRQVYKLWVILSVETKQEIFLSAKSSAEVRFMGMGRGEDEKGEKE